MCGWVGCLFGVGGSLGLFVPSGGGGWGLLVCPLCVVCGWRGGCVGGGCVGVCVVGCGVVS